MWLISIVKESQNSNKTSWMSKTEDLSRVAVKHLFRKFIVIDVYTPSSYFKQIAKAKQISLCRKGKRVYWLLVSQKFARHLLKHVWTGLWLENPFSRRGNAFAHDIRSPCLESRMALSCYTSDRDGQSAAVCGQQNQPPGRTAGTQFHTLDIPWSQSHPRSAAIPRMHRGTQLDPLPWWFGK